MRGVLLAAATVVGCSGGGRGGSGATDAGDAGAACVAGTLTLGGALTQTPHGIFLLSNASLTSSGFSAMLPAGGSVQLAWNGDATSGPVSVDGMLVIPAEGTMQSWCVAGASSVRVSGTSGTLQLQLATAGDVQVEPDGTCVEVDDAGVQLPLGTEAATGCFALGS
jgi:hypothetical protein